MNEWVKRKQSRVLFLMTTPSTNTRDSINKNTLFGRTFFKYFIDPSINLLLLYIKSSNEFCKIETTRFEIFRGKFLDKRNK